MTQTGGEKELIIGNKQLISLFFVVVALCGVFFAMGYMVRGNSLKGTVSTTAPDSASSATPSDSDKRQQPQPPAETTDTTAVSPQPAEASDNTPAAPIETRPVPEIETKATTKTPKADAPAPAPAAVSSVESGASYVQVGALARADAESTVRTLREQHLPAIVAASSKEGLFRVLVGPYHLTSDVADAKSKLKELGFSNTIVQKQ